MEFIRKNLKYIIILVSIFFIFQVSFYYYNVYHNYSFEREDLILRYFLIVAVYSLLFYHVYRLRKAKHVVSILIEILTLALTASIFIAIPAVYAKTAGIISAEVGYLYIAEVNILFALFLSITVYMTKYISYALSKTIFLISINTVFIVNSVAIGVLYVTGFEIGPTVFLHFSWEAIKVGAGDYLIIFFIMIVLLIPVNKFFLKIMKSHKYSLVNYTVVCLAVLAILLNSVILNFNLYKTKAISPAYKILDTAVKYSSSDAIDMLVKYRGLNVDDQEKEVLSKLGIKLDALIKPVNIVKPIERKNLIMIYLESFQLNFTKHGDELYSGLTPNINSLSSDYVVYHNFINSVTPTINAMISSQCGVDVILNTKKIIGKKVNSLIRDDINLRKSNRALLNDDIASDLLEDKLECLSDVLHDSGYYQVMMKGGSISFSGKGKFFKAHGYDQTLGVKELNADNKYKELNTWGLQDPMLIDEALNMLETLKNKQPFNLTFLTVNSHLPGYEYSKCPVYKEGNAILNGIHCTDYALGMFLKKLKKMDIYKNTVVVIAGDHVMFNAKYARNILSDVPLSWYGRTYLAIHSPDAGLNQSNEIFGVTSDLAPTMLELLGFKNMNFISGKSLISERKKYQRITANSFDIINGRMIPEMVEFFSNNCSIEDAAQERIYDSEQYTDCQRARIYHLQQKAIYQ